MKAILLAFLFLGEIFSQVRAQQVLKPMPAGGDLYQADIAHAQLDTISYYSRTVGTKRSAVVYLPPGYNKAHKYPVLYLLHGIGGDEYEWLNNGHPQNILDNLFALGKIAPMIVVMPNGRAMKNDDATGDIMAPQKIRAFATFEKDLIKDLIPFIEKKYSTYTDKDHRAIAGLSMGAGQSLNFGLSHLDLFGWVGAFSAAPNTRKPEVLVPNPAKTKGSLKLLWISCGASDGLIKYSKRTHDYLLANKVPHIYFIEPGVHDFKVWKDGLYMFAQLLFKPVDTRAFAKYPVAGAPATTNVRGASYPQVLASGRVKFKVKAPQATHVQVDLGKIYDMIKGKNGYWHVTTDSIGEGFHYYSLIIDGATVADPASKTFYGMGRMASGIEIPFDKGDYYEIKKVPHGDIRIEYYFSKTTQRFRQMYIYTPPGYKNNPTGKYPVLYLLHGGGEDQTGWTAQGRMNFIMDNLIAAKQATPMLVVMPDANMANGGLNAAGVQQSMTLFEQELKNNIIPFVEEHYHVKGGAANRALAGLSMGGMHTLYTGLYHTDMFAYLGVFSSGWIPKMMDGVANKQYQYLQAHADKINHDLKQFWIAEGGPEDIAYKNGMLMLRKLKDLHINYTYDQYHGGHSWPVWRNNLYHFAKLLFK